MAYRISDHCVACQKCERVCPVRAIRFDGEQFRIDGTICVECGACAEVCPRQAIHPEDYKEQPVTRRDGILKKDCGFLVIGSGPSGLCAAIRVAEQGYPVTVLEALNVPGGAGLYATFMRAFGTKWEKDAELPDLTDDYIRAAMNATHWQLDYSLVQNAFHALSECFDWFCTFGEAGQVFAIQDTPYGKSVEMADFRKPSAPHVMKKYLQRAEELGIEILLNTRAVRLLLEDGKILGVMAEDPAGRLELTCRTCLIATGNMAVSDEISRFAPEYGRAVHNRNAHRLPSATGDGVRMAEEAGIPIDEKGVACHFLGAMPSFFDGDVLRQGLRCEGIRVNLYGERFLNECLDRFEAVPLVAKQSGCLTYNVIDSKILYQEILPTIKLPTDIGGNLQRGVPIPGKPLPMVDFMGFPVPLDENGKPIRSRLLDAGDQSMLKVEKQDVLDKLKGFVPLKGAQVCVADTIEELAEQMGVPAGKLRKTVEHYNEMCRNGRDDDLGKYPNYMFPVEQAPFIAIKCYLGSDGAFGGIFIDDCCRVKGRDGVIKGLYATGDVTSGNFIKERCSRIEIINDFTWANASGFLAAEDVKKYLAGA